MLNRESILTRAELSQQCDILLEAGTVENIAVVFERKSKRFLGCRFIKNSYTDFSLVEDGGCDCESVEGGIGHRGPGICHGPGRKDVFGLCLPSGDSPRSKARDGKGNCRCSLSHNAHPVRYKGIPIVPGKGNFVYQDEDEDVTDEELDLLMDACGFGDE